MDIYFFLTGVAADFSIEPDEVKKIERLEDLGQKTPTFIVTQQDGTAIRITSLKLLHRWNRASSYLMKTGLKVVAGAVTAELEIKNILRISLTEDGKGSAHLTMRNGEKMSVELEHGYNKLYGMTRDGPIFFAFIQKVKDIEFMRLDP